jgi:hypothetical protein
MRPTGVSVDSEGHELTSVCRPPMLRRAVAIRLTRCKNIHGANHGTIMAWAGTEPFCCR